jgi:hypothetical protein
MKIRYQADNDFNYLILEGVKRRGVAIDFQSARGLNLHGVSDLEVLSRAANEGRILVTHDWHTMTEHFFEFVRGSYSPGVFVIAQKVPVGIAVEALEIGWNLSEAEEWENQLVALPSWNVMGRGVVPKSGSR